MEGISFFTAKLVICAYQRNLKINIVLVQYCFIIEIITFTYYNYLLMILQCVEKMSRTNCPICLEDIHTSRIPSHIPSCGHLIHRTCFNSFIHRGHYACPVCQTSMMPMESVNPFYIGLKPHLPKPVYFIVLAYFGRWNRINSDAGWISKLFRYYFV